MAWPRPRCLFHLAKSLHPVGQLKPCFRYVRPHISSATTLGNFEQRLFSISYRRKDAFEQDTSSLESSVPAAPPIDFSDPNAVPARVLPASPSYFTGSPKFIDHYLKLDSLRSKYATLPALPPNMAPRVAWLRVGELRDAIGEIVPVAKYRKLQKVLHRLNLIHPSIMPEEVRKTLDFFTRPGDPFQMTKVQTVPDELGRACAVGRRKTSSARAWLVEGDGQILVNDKNIIELFPRLHDRESVLWPLKSANRIDKYNLWAKVRGGGITGKAEALTVAIAKALIIHEPGLKPILRRGKLFIIGLVIQ